MESHIKYITQETYKYHGMKGRLTEAEYQILNRAMMMNIHDSISYRYKGLRKTLLTGKNY